MGLRPSLFLCSDDYNNCRFYCKYCHIKYKFAIVVTIFKNVKGKYCQIFGNDNTITDLKYNL